MHDIYKIAYIVLTAGIIALAFQLVMKLGFLLYRAWEITP